MSETKHTGCVFFDFDSTITKHHLWKSIYWPNYASQLTDTRLWDDASKTLINGRYIKNPKEDPSPMIKEAKSYIKWVFGETEEPGRIDKVKKFFVSLNEHGVNAYILSLGITREIVAALEAAGIEPYLFRGIYGGQIYPYDANFPEMWSNGAFSVPKFKTADKVGTMLLLEQECKDGPMVYIDDDPTFYPYADAVGIITIGIGPNCSSRFSKDQWIGMSDQQMQCIMNIFSVTAEGCLNCGTSAKPWTDEICLGCRHLLTRGLAPREEIPMNYFNKYEKLLHGGHMVVGHGAAAAPSYDSWRLAK